MPLSIYAIDDVLDTNREGLDIIKRCESFQADWYLCPADIWTIGYGITEGGMPGVSRRELAGPIDERTAEKLLIRGVITQYEPAVERYQLALNTNQFSALVSFVYNVGAQAFGSSTLLRKLKEGDRMSAADEFLRWVKAGGRTLPGLVKRRQAERALFLDEPEDLRRELLDRLEKMDVLPVTSLPARSLQIPKLLDNPYREYRE